MRGTHTLSQDATHPVLAAVIHRVKTQPYCHFPSLLLLYFYRLFDGYLHLGDITPCKVSETSNVRCSTSKPPRLQKCPAATNSPGWRKQHYTRTVQSIMGKVVPPLTSNLCQPWLPRVYRARPRASAVRDYGYGGKLRSRDPLSWTRDRGERRGRPQGRGFLSSSPYIWPYAFNS